jgi:O-antigen ligase
VNNSQLLTGSRQIRRHLPFLALAGITLYLFGSQWVLGIPMLHALVLLLAGAFGLMVFLRPLWGYYALVATFSAEFILALSQTFTATKALGAVVFASWALEAVFRRSYRLPRTPLLVLVPLFYATALLSVFPAEDVRMVGLRLTTLLQLSALVFITATIIKDAKRVRHVAWIILLSTFVSVAYGIAKVGSGKQMVLEGFALDRNRFGMIIAICIPLGFYLYPRSRKRGRFVLLSLIGVFLVAEALTYSRGGFLAMLLSLVLSLLFVIHSHRVRLIIWVSLLLLALGIAMPASYWDRMGSILPSMRGGTDTVGQRYEFWEISLKMIRDHPLLGVGAGNYTVLFARYSGIISLRRGAAVAHNSFLGVTAEQGIPGGLLFLSLFVAGFWTLRRSYQKAKANGDTDVMDLAICYAVILLVFVSQCMKGNYEHNKYLWISFGMTAAIAALSDRRRDSVDGPEPEGDDA